MKTLIVAIVIGLGLATLPVEARGYHGPGGDYGGYYGRGYAGRGAYAAPYVYDSGYYGNTRYGYPSGYYGPSVVPGYGYNYNGYYYNRPHGRGGFFRRLFR
jgi:hypothetical protein